MKQYAGFFHLTLLPILLSLVTQRGKTAQPSANRGPSFKCSRAGISRAEVLVWPVKRKRKPSVKSGGTSRFGFYPRIPQAPIILYGCLQVRGRNPFSAPFLCSTPGTHRFPGASMEPSERSREARTAGFAPYGFRKMPFSNLNWGEGRTAR